MFGTNKQGCERVCTMQPYNSIVTYPYYRPFSSTYLHASLNEDQHWPWLESIVWPGTILPGKFLDIHAI